MDIKFGRLVPETWTHVEKYPFKKLTLESPLTVERRIKVPALRSYYDQGQYGACVGFSSSWMMSIYNSPPTEKYDAMWLYHQAQLNDNDPFTDPTYDNGTYVWAAFDVLKKQGHRRVFKDREGDPLLSNGIKSYYWCKSVDEIRTAISLKRPVVFGINWYNEFMNPIKKDGEDYIGTKSLGSILGGHAICCYGASDKRESFRLINSWGLAYPLVWITYKTVERLIKEDGEFCVAIDNPLGKGD